MLRSVATARLGDAAAGPSTCRAGRFSLVPARRSHLGCGRSHRSEVHATRYLAALLFSVARISQSRRYLSRRLRDQRSKRQSLGRTCGSVRICPCHRAHAQAPYRLVDGIRIPCCTNGSASRILLAASATRDRRNRVDSIRGQSAANSLGSSQSPPITLRRFEHPHCRVDHRLAPTRAWRHLCKPPPEASVPRLRSVQSSPFLESWLYSHGSSPVLP